ncbi:MAG TPA: SURF1 family protein [Steroidobacteraceae bacterium]
MKQPRAETRDDHRQRDKHEQPDDAVHGEGSVPKSFAPTAGFSALALFLCALFICLGVWQWRRGGVRQEEWSRFARGTDALVALGDHGLDQLPLFQHVSVSGTLDGAHQFLLDNRTHRGTAGYEVLTPLRRAAGRTLLVDRGWVPFSGSRRTLPDIALANVAVLTLTGRAARLPSAGLAAGRAAPNPADPWPKVTSYPSAAELAAALGAPLEARVVLLDPEAPHGYVRDWQPPGISPLRNFSYAIQWWCFAALALVLWAVMSRKSRSA